MPDADVVLITGQSHRGVIEGPGGGPLVTPHGVGGRCNIVIVITTLQASGTKPE